MCEGSNNIRVTTGTDQFDLLWVPIEQLIQAATHRCSWSLWLFQRFFTVLLLLIQITSNNNRTAHFAAYASSLYVPGEVCHSLVPALITTYLATGNGRFLGLVCLNRLANTAQHWLSHGSISNNLRHLRTLLTFARTKTHQDVTSSVHGPLWYKCKAHRPGRGFKLQVFGCSNIGDGQTHRHTMAQRFSIQV